ncbi:hypothetical protein [Cumulibacter soli]|uniref:hypothetical protein n=1 Tax=Cumulibacter soli TaxID=2546344 RepID=UPI001067CC62|nr:hypothetical protein [Cumulibacter soli]
MARWITLSGANVDSDADMTRHGWRRVDEPKPRRAPRKPRKPREPRAKPAASETSEEPAGE